jgi:hypothetical protein
VKFEGFVFLALAGGWLLLLPSARPCLKPSPCLWRVLTFCFLAALPFVCLRVRIPILHYESHWASYALHHPVSTLSNWPGIFVVLLSRCFVNPAFANWSGENGRLQWTGTWNGFSSMYDHSTLGLAWVCLFTAIALWFAAPARRRIIVWMLVVFVSTIAAFSAVFSSFVSVTNLAQVLDYTSDRNAGRYLFPMLLAWYATIMTLLYADLSLPASTPGADATISSKSGNAGFFSRFGTFGAKPAGNSGGRQLPLLVVDGLFVPGDLKPLNPVNLK